jgi:hypothetical protein
VTGILNTSLAQWLLETDRVEAPYVVSQGAALGRAGCVHVSREESGQVWVGGGSVTGGSRHRDPLTASRAPKSPEPGRGSPSGQACWSTQGA